MILQSLAGCIGTLLRKTRHRNLFYALGPPPLINALAQTRHSTTWTFIIEQERGGKFHVQRTLFEKVLDNRARGAIKIVDFKEI